MKHSGCRHVLISRRKSVAFVRKWIISAGRWEKRVTLAAEYVNALGRRQSFLCRDTLDSWRPHTRHAFLGIPKLLWYKNNKCKLESCGLWPHLLPFFVLRMSKSGLKWRRKNVFSVSSAETLKKTSRVLDVQIFRDAPSNWSRQAQCVATHSFRGAAVARVVAGRNQLNLTERR